MPDQRTVSS